MEKTKKMKTYKKKADPNSRPIKYLKNRIEGLNKSESQLKAGYADVYHPTRIEESTTYQAGLLKYLIGEEEIANEHNKNIKQDKDKGAKNTALNMWYKLNSKYPKEQGELEAGDLKIVVKKETG